MNLLLSILIYLHLLLPQALVTSQTRGGGGGGGVTKVASLTSNAFTNTIVLTTTANVALHGRVWVVIGSNQDLSTFISTVTDQVSNTYACVTVTDSPNGESGAICTGYMSTALPSGDTITFTEANSSNGAFAVAYATSTSATSSNTADTSGTATGTSSTPSATTAGNLTATDNVISISCYNNANTFSSNGTGYTGLDNALNANSYAFSMATQWKSQTSGATATGGIAVSSSGYWASLIGAYK